ncbi:hypothetical protein BIFGAL_04166 [Bifidobacterium gallicum DSM 20093 = LMG 11596]|uniref:Uncharacterized protein n=1 Tax=Bifidobacterium gallicum DSM 20093 = LMG 11596 TaxID=561180 RepID=D1NWB7_9BIFI|nr:hypothetical protein BIFGAL_04166 [Bifidobacterium gallicum DSM 20093 = LMG 11596]
MHILLLFREETVMRPLSLLSVVSYTVGGHMMHACVPHKREVMM